MLEDDVRVVGRPEQFEIVPGVHSQEEVPRSNLEPAVRNDQSRVAIRQRSAVLGEPDLDSLTRSSPAPVVELGRELDVVGAVVGKVDLRTRGDEHAVCLCGVSDEHRRRCVDRRDLISRVEE
jgi:hypothetical protein